MTKLKRVSAKKDDNIADFLITITKTEDGLELEGVEGTAWKDLKFSLGENEKQIISHIGLAYENRQPQK